MLDNRLRHSRFNKIGNREMYMNCAVVNIVPKGSKHSRDAQPEALSPRDTAIANAAAQSALSSYPSLFVANLAGVNDCVTKETQDVMFDNPGNNVQYADGKSGGAKPSFGKGQCTGRGSKNAGSSSPSSSSPPPSSPGKSKQGDDGQWKDPSSSQSSSKCANANDGQWHPECYGGADSQKAISGSSLSSDSQAKPAKQAQSQDSAEDIKTGGDPSGEVEKDLQDYLSTLYGSSSNSKRADCGSVKRDPGPCASPNRWVKKSACAWECKRKSHIVKRATDDVDLKATLNIELAVLASNIVHLINSVSQKQSLDRRQPYDSSDASAPPPGVSTFDLFLTYLSQLQSTVIECIRGLAAAAPTERPVEAAQIIPVEPAIPVEHFWPQVTTTPAALLELSQPLPTPEPAGLLLGPPQLPAPPVPTPVFDPAFDPAFVSTIPEKRKRQLIVPDITIFSWLNDIDPSTLGTDVDVEKLVDGLQAVGREIVRVVKALQAPKPPFRHGPPIAALAPFLNGTSPFNATNNPLQAAADAAGFDAALVADGKANTPPSPPLSTAAALLPYLMGPGPVVPPGVVIDWPGPNKYNDGDDGDVVSNLEDFPIVVNDLEDEDSAKEEVRKWFEELGKGAEKAGEAKDDVVA